RKLRVWDAVMGKELRSLSVPNEGGQALVFSPDSRWLAASGGQSHGASIWNTKTWSETKLPKGCPYFTGLAFSPDSKRLASSSYSGLVQVWDIEEGKELLTVTGHRGSVTNVAMSSDSKWLASCSTDGTVRLWDAKGRDESLFDRYNRRWAVAFSPDGNA